MFRSQVIVRILSVCGFLTGATNACAQEAKAPAVEGKPAGRRVGHMLLVNAAVTDAVVKAANIDGHQSLGGPYVRPGGCRVANRRLVRIGGRYGSGGFRIVCFPGCELHAN
ncbi:MAG: hypothetical protein ACI8TX_002088 [Hyphomicrobiaceae bacterium]|jgi:hypothetical protein